MTRRQAALLCYLRRRALVDDVSPSFEEMRVAIGLRSKSEVGRLVLELRALGLIRRVKNRARSITVTGIDDYARGYRDGQRDARAEDQAARCLGWLEAGLDVTGDISHLLTAGA